MKAIPENRCGRLLPEIQTPATAALITGDFSRLELFCDALGARVGEIWKWREFEFREVHLDRGVILVGSHGTGGYAVAFIVEELADSGIDTVIRIGSCGAMQEYLEPGHIIVSSGSVRDEGVSRDYLPIEVPAVPDPLLAAGLYRELVHRSPVPVWMGVTHCESSYYVQHPDRVATSGVAWEDRWWQLRKAGVIATEGEAAALFSVAMARRTRAAAAVIVGGEWDNFGTSLEPCVRAAAAAALTHESQEGE